MNRRPHFVFLLMLAASGLWTAVPLRCQVDPLNDPSVVVSPTASHAASNPATEQNEPIAFIRGWSTGMESDTSLHPPESRVTLDASHPEIITFFDAQPIAGRTEFRYRLDGYDADWTVTREHLAHYRRLPPGTYLFRVQARLPGRTWTWSAAHGSLRVEQKAFFYQTWYAVALAVCLLLALGTQLLQQRDQLMKGRIGIVLQERNRIAGECHDTLMAGFAAISWQLEATAKLLANDNAPAARSFDLARSMVAHCQAEARRIIWDLRDSDEITNCLSTALTEATSTYRERERPRTTFQVHGREIPISPSAVHHLVCIGQEAVTNAIKHADPANIRIELAYEEDLLRLTIRDDGRGFSPSDRSARTGHFGVAVMEERARKLGGTLHLASSLDNGTEVSVKVDFQHIHQPVVRQHDLVRWIGV